MLSRAPRGRGPRSQKAFDLVEGKRQAQRASVNSAQEVASESGQDVGRQWGIQGNFKQREQTGKRKKR